MSKFLIRRLRSFKYKNKSGFYDNILGKYNIGRVMVKKCFVPHV